MPNCEQYFEKMLPTLMARLKDRSEPNENKFSSFEEAKEILGYGKTTIKKLRDEREITYKQYGKKFIYETASLHAFNDRQLIKAKYENER